MQKKTGSLCGAHVSIEGGFYKAIERGEYINGNVIQIFTKSNRQWASKELNDKDITLFKEKQKTSPIRIVVAHASYLINIGSPDETCAKKSVDALIDELQRCNALAIPYLVLHPGSHTKSDEAACLIQISKNLDKALEQSNGSTTVLLENMAGQGSTVCYSFEQIAKVIKKAKNRDKIGVCFDTCHAFAAGYDFRTEHDYNEMWKQFDKIIGLDKLHAIHINDSKKDLGARVDRHENIGQGKIGIDAFSLLLNDPRFFAIPKILETPYATIEDHKENMLVINSLIKD